MLLRVPAAEEAGLIEFICGFPSRCGATLLQLIGQLVDQLSYIKDTTEQMFPVTHWAGHCFSEELLYKYFPQTPLIQGLSAPWTGGGPLNQVGPP